MLPTFTFSARISSSLKELIDVADEDGWMDRLSKCDEAVRTNSAAALQYTSEEGWEKCDYTQLEWQMLGLETCLRNIDKKLEPDDSKGLDF